MRFIQTAIITLALATSAVGQSYADIQVKERDAEKIADLAPSPFYLNVDAELLTEKMFDSLLFDSEIPRFIFYFHGAPGASEYSIKENREFFEKAAKSCGTGSAKPKAVFVRIVMSYIWIGDKMGSIKPLQFLKERGIWNNLAQDLSYWNIETGEFSRIRMRTRNGAPNSPRRVCSDKFLNFEID